MHRNWNNLLITHCRRPTACNLFSAPTQGDALGCLISALQAEKSLGKNRPILSKQPVRLKLNSPGHRLLLEWGATISGGRDRDDRDISDHRDNYRVSHFVHYLCLPSLLSLWSLMSLTDVPIDLSPPPILVRLA